MITGACASSAGNKDSQNMSDILSQTIKNLQNHYIDIQEVVADAGYSSGESIAYCEQNNIDAYITNFGQYKSHREGFEYHPTENYYQCVKLGGNQAKLEYKGIKIDSKGYQKKSYRSSESDCKNCPLRVSCCGAVTRFKKIEDSIDKPYYDRMHQKLTKNAGFAQKIKKIRSRTVEPVLGTLLNFINMKRVNTRGKRGANKHVMMSALTYNLKKYLNFHRKKAETACRNRFNTWEAFFSFEWLVSKAILVLFKIPSLTLNYTK